MSENKPWDKVERRRTESSPAETALRIALRAEQDGIRKEDVFLRSKDSSKNHMRYIDFYKDELRRMLGHIFDVVDSRPALRSIETFVSELFNSPDYGYKSYALPVLGVMGFDPQNLPEGSEPFWNSPEAALQELLSHLTPKMVKIIVRDYECPAIVVEPIMDPKALLSREDSSTFDGRLFRFGKIHVVLSPFAESRLAQKTSIGGEGRILGWRIGIGDVCKIPKFLHTDGDKNTVNLRTRVARFRETYLPSGFDSMMDHPLLYIAVADYGILKKEGDTKTIIDYIARSSIFCRTAESHICRDSPYVMVGSCENHDYAKLTSSFADRPNNGVHMRLSLMFTKSDERQKQPSRQYPKPALNKTLYK